MFSWEDLFPGGYCQAVREVEELYHLKYLLEKYGISPSSLEIFLQNTHSKEYIEGLVDRI